MAAVVAESSSEKCAGLIRWEAALPRHWQPPEGVELAPALIPLPPAFSVRVMCAVGLLTFAVSQSRGVVLLAGISWAWPPIVNSGVLL